MKFIIFILSFFLLQCAQKPVSQEASAARSANWKADMHVLANSISKLLPLAVSSNKFYDKKNNKVIKAELKRMVDVAKRIQKSKHAAKDDPIISFTAKKFSQDLSYSYEQYKIGNLDFAQSNIRNATNFCMGCHTRNDKGQQFDWQLGADLKLLNKIDRAQYFTAIRDFDNALAEYKSILTSGYRKKINSHEWMLSAKRSMAIAVRVKNDPKIASSVVDSILKTKSITPSQTQTLLQWKKAINEWKGDKLVKGNEQKKARELLRKGRQATPLPQSSDGLVYFLRSSAILHNLMEGSLSKERKAQSLYTSGLVAENLRDINMWTLHEAYYESCIRKIPRTPLAKKCYLRYESVVMANYVNTGKGQVPVHVRHHLDDLRKIAEMGNWNEILNWGLVE